MAADRALERTHALGEEQQAQHLAVEVGLLEASVADRVGEPRPRRRRAGHREVLRGGHRVEAPHGGPVGDHDTVEAPLGVERRLEQVVLGHRDTVDGVVCAHDRPCASLHGALERQQVELSQGALVHPHVDREAVGLGVVRDVVLRRRGDAVALHPLDVGRAELAREPRVLAEALEVAAAEGRTVQVDRRAEHDVDALAPGLGCRCGAVAVRERRVPRRGERRARREVERRVALIPDRAAHARRTIRERHRAQADVRQRNSGPEVRALHERDLVLERESLEEGSQVVGGGGHAWIPSVGADSSAAAAAASGLVDDAASAGLAPWAAMKSRYQCALSLGMRARVG